MAYLDYNKYIVAFSGGKDSVACVLWLLESGVDRSKIELWHHLPDGKDEVLMDWEVTEDYCKKFAKQFGLKIYFSWKDKGFLGEMTRQDRATLPTYFETPEGLKCGGGKGKPGTRMKFPQVSPNLSVRWCSSFLKIDPFKMAIRNQDRFKGIKTLVLTGERGEESPNRAKYAQFEPHPADLRNGKRYQRHIDQLRPVLYYTESQVWALIKKHGVVVHPCYYLGYSRCSCKFCIFGNANQFASGKNISPLLFGKLVKLENTFGITMKRNTDLETLASDGTPYEAITEELVKLATSYEYTGKIIVDPKFWLLPAGAYGESCGPA